MGKLILHSIIASVFVFWFVLSVINQFKFRWFERVLAFDYFSLIPYWTFFAPNPGQTDYHLIYRDKLPDGTTTNWREVELTEPRRLISCVWNPKKRSSKVLSDVALSIAEVVRADPGVEQAIIISFQYLLILNYVTKAIAALPGIQRQFAIVETAGFFRGGVPNVVLRSDFHSLEPATVDGVKEQVPA